MNKDEKELFDRFNKLNSIRDKYILDKEKNIIPANLGEWSNFLKNTREERMVAKNEVNGRFISTVFIGIDHNFYQNENNEIHIFETMVFESKENYSGIYCSRCGTWERALEEHQKAIEWVKNGENDD